MDLHQIPWLLTAPVRSARMAIRRLQDCLKDQTQSIKFHHIVLQSENQVLLCRYISNQDIHNGQNGFQVRLDVQMLRRGKPKVHGEDAKTDRRRCFLHLRAGVNHKNLIKHGLANQLCLLLLSLRYFPLISLTTIPLVRIPSISPRVAFVPGTMLAPVVY